MSGLRAGVIGLGVGERHATALDRNTSCDLVALCDFDPEVLENVGARFPSARRYGDAMDVLAADDVDVVAIASYDNFHFKHVEQALTSGMHVFIEKPLCLHESQARHLRNLLNVRSDLRLSSNLILRMSPRFQRVKRMVEDNDLGELYYLEADYLYGRLHKITSGWRGQLAFYSVMYGGGVHMVDLVLWLNGGKVEEVSAYGSRIASSGSDFRFDDLVVGLLHFENGVVAKVSANFGCVHPHFHKVEIYGTKGTFKNALDNAIFYPNRNPDDAIMVSDPYPGIDKGSLLDNFVDSVVVGSTPIVTADDVFNTMSVCFALEKSAREGKQVTVEYL